MARPLTKPARIEPAYRVRRRAAEAKRRPSWLKGVLQQVRELNDTAARASYRSPRGQNETVYFTDRIVATDEPAARAYLMGEGVAR